MIFQLILGELILGNSEKVDDASTFILCLVGKDSKHI